MYTPWGGMTQREPDAPARGGGSPTRQRGAGEGSPTRQRGTGLTVEEVYAPSLARRASWAARRPSVRVPHGPSIPRSLIAAAFGEPLRRPPARRVHLDVAHERR